MVNFLKNVMSWVHYVRTDKHVCVFPQCQNLLNISEFTWYGGFPGSNLLSTSAFLGNVNREATPGSLSTLILITNTNSQIACQKVPLCACVS